jgi:hypothetical protein
MPDAKDTLKKHVIPALRTRGFTGSFPHFRRSTNSATHLITFQMDRWGSGNFVVELAKAPLGDFKMLWGQTVPSNKLTAHHLNDRHRLGASASNLDYWFQSSDFASNPTGASSHLLSLLDSQGAHWWSGT